jgi:hypothetical protein
MRWWRWALLLFELCLFALVLVLPQVDLPDFAFHGGTAPVVAKSKFSSAPVLSSGAAPVQARLPQHVHEIRNQPIGPEVRLKPSSLLSLLCALLC